MKSVADSIRTTEEKQRTDTAPHVIVQALAGTGKTTTLVEGLKRLFDQPTSITPSPQQQAVWNAIMLSKDHAATVGFCAFNRSIAEELQRRVPAGCSAMTMHSMGLKAVTRHFGRVKITSDRVQDIICKITGKEIWDLRRDRMNLLRAVDQLASLCKMNLVTGTRGWAVNPNGIAPCNFEDMDNTLEQLASYYDIDLNGDREEVFQLVPKVLERCLDVSSDMQINFDDMIWLPVALDLPVFKYDLLLVDEAQDLNRCQQQLALMASNRLILCGDSGQAIYGFAGADSQSLARMQETLSAKSHCIDGKHAFPECLAAEGASWNGTPHVKGCQCTTTDRGVALLPLTVTRRCGKAIVTEAQKIVPEFEAHESNGEGKVSNVSLRNGMPVSPQGLVVTINSRFVDVVNDGDMIISRVNAPLVSLCFKFIKAKKKANIQGRKVGEGLIALIKKMKCSTVVELQYKLCRWLSAETQREQAKKFPSESRLLGLQDRYDCICCFMEGETEVPTVITKINDLFTDDTQPNGIRLSSIHRSKGLEARRVFFLQTKDAPCPHPMAKSAWEKKQESNLKYVGITRAIEELIYVTD